MKKYLIPKVYPPSLAGSLGDLESILVRGLGVSGIASEATSSHALLAILSLPWWGGRSSQACAPSSPGRKPAVTADGGVPGPAHRAPLLH